MIRCASPDCSRAGPRSRSTIAAGIRAALTCSGRSTAPRAICSSPPPAARPRSSRSTYAAARAHSPRSRSCPCQSSIAGRRRNARALPPTSPKRTRVSPATIARERISAPPSKTRSRAIACWTRSRRPRRPVIVKRSADPRRGARPIANLDRLREGSRRRRAAGPSRHLQRRPYALRHRGHEPRGRRDPGRESVPLDRSVPSLRSLRPGGHALPVPGDQAGDRHLHVRGLTRGAVGQPRQTYRGLLSPLLLSVLRPYSLVEEVNEVVEELGPRERTSENSEHAKFAEHTF